MPVLTRLLNALRPPYRLHSVYERLLGTEVEVQVIATTRQDAEMAEGCALAEQERLTAILNRFDPSSELRRWLLRPGERVALSADLLEVLRLAENWRVVSGGAFHAGADALGAIWQRAAQQGLEPNKSELAAQAKALAAAPWTLYTDGTATLHATYPIGLNALAKGFIVDRMAEAAYHSAGVQTVLINAGGDLRTIGGKGLSVAVADPLTARDDALPITHVQVRGGALATSGRAHRGYQVGEKWHSHILDPRTGQPVNDVPGVTVTAPTCATADALATVLSVMDIPAGLQLAEETPGCAALIVTRDGRRQVTSGWGLPPPDTG